MDRVAQPTGGGTAAGREAPVILASASPSRRALLENAGLPVRAEAAQIDEGEVKASLRAEGADAAQVAETLAELKAQRIARRHGGALVIGADQMLECDGACSTSRKPWPKPRSISPSWAAAATPWSPAPAWYATESACGTTSTGPG